MSDCHGPDTTDVVKPNSSYAATGAMLSRSAEKPIVYVAVGLTDAGSIRMRSGAVRVLPPPCAVTVTSVVRVTGAVVTSKVALRAPNGIPTDAGTLAAGLS